MKRSYDLSKTNDGVIKRIRGVLKRTKGAEKRTQAATKCQGSTKQLKQELGHESEGSSGQIPTALEWSSNEEPHPRHGRSTEVAKTLKQSEAPPTINDLPDEILLTIFSYTTQRDLRTLAKVNRRWHDVANDRSFWYYVISNGHDFTTDELCDIIRTKPFIKELYLQNRRDCNAILDVLLRANRSLETLILIGCRGNAVRRNVRAHLMVRLLKRCDKLTALYVDDTTFRSCEFYRRLMSAETQARIDKLHVHVNLSRRELATVVTSHEKMRTRMSAEICQ